MSSFLFPWTISSITFPLSSGRTSRAKPSSAGIYGRPPAHLNPEHPFLSAGLLLGEGGILVPRKGDDGDSAVHGGRETVSLAVQNQALIAKAGNKTLTIRLLDKRVPGVSPDHPPMVHGQVDV